MAEPVEKAQELETEASAGQTARAPFLALTGVSLVVLGFVTLVIAIVVVALLVFAR